MHQLSSLTRTFILCFYFFVSCPKVNAKYLEGFIESHEDWVFVSRFCFLSEEGRYEYFFEYDRTYGDLQLLLYYDEPDQWHSVYKTSKTCKEKISVLSVRDNQIVTLSAKSPYFIKSGCNLRSSAFPRGDTKSSTTSKPTQTNNDLDSIHFDQFIKTTPASWSSASVEASTSTFSSPKYFENFTEFDIEDFNMTSPDFRSMIYDQEAKTNGIENTTDFQNDVEEMMIANEHNRTKREANSNFYENSKQTIYVSCHNQGGFTSSRPRWWYIVLANCGSIKGLKVRYKFKMTNGPSGDFWHEHFSADEMYIPRVILCEILAYTFLLLAVFVCGMELKTRSLYHCTYRLYTMSVILYFSGVLMNSVTWAKYAVSGIGPFMIFGGLFTGSSEITFLLLILLMSKGYTISRARIPTASTVKVTIFINLYVVVFISLYIYQTEAFDPGEVLNLYESAAGFALAGLRCFAWAFFMISCTTTMKKFPEKKSFYFPFAILGTLWIMCLPILIFLVISLLDPWVRESVVYCVNALIAFAGHSTFLFLTWPSRANRHFPYHVKTNHIGIASNDGGSDFPRHTYEASGQDMSIIIPLSRRTEEFITSGYNSGFTRDVEYYRHNEPTSIPQQCFPSRSIHNRLPSPTHGLPSLINSKIYGNDTLANHGEDDESDTESGIAKIDSSETINKRLSSFESVESEERKDFPLQNTSQDNDSGHLSLEVTTSPNSTGNSSTPTDRSLHSQESSKNVASSLPPLAPILKENPFKVSTKSQNKLVLDPIRLPENLQKTSIGYNNSTENVPRHLFTIKKN